MATGWTTARAPATIANVGPGFDVFCLAIRGPFDAVSIRAADRDSLAVEGPQAGDVPADFTQNTAGIVLDALRQATGVGARFQVRVRKGIPAARGLGSSAASCAAAALAFRKVFPREARRIGLAGLIGAAAEGEAVVSGRHYDNASGALLGGFVSLASVEPLVLARESVSPRVHIAIAIPAVSMKTWEMRQVLPDLITRADAVSNVGMAATLALALARGDVVLAGSCLHDRLAEPYRAGHLPGYVRARAAARKSGAAGFALCGSGSSVFGFATSAGAAVRCAEAMRAAFAADGVKAAALATRVDNTCAVRDLVPHRGPRFSLAVGLST